jgi:PhzF family phenazine biosynthesis protein
MKLPIFQIDAFTDKVFAGNPAAVCPLSDWIDEALMQEIAAENNLSETAFFVGREGKYDLRWFTPTTEIDLCGHATLASGSLILDHLEKDLQVVKFDTRSGELIVTRLESGFEMDFPAQPPGPCDVPGALVEALGVEPIEILAAADFFVVLGSEDEVVSVSPNFERLKTIPLRGVIVTALGKEVDFVSRFFGPRFGINEDPVTGSAHCALAPYWSAKLGTDILVGRQLSKRGGSISCRVIGERVLLSGQCAMYLKGEITIGNDI